MLPTLFSCFFERIMSDALEEHERNVSIGGRNITSLRFADDMVKHLIFRNLNCGDSI